MTISEDGPVEVSLIHIPSSCPVSIDVEIVERLHLRGGVVDHPHRHDWNMNWLADL